ncbi:MAG: hypothetical protein Q8L40_11565 [Burkholderiales bacterium]|nr:hypothetical protein [Burkholderiales bacterium]
MLDPGLKQRVIDEGLKPYLEDNSQAWEMDQQGQYRPKSPQRGKLLIVQDYLLDLLVRRPSA